MNWSTERPTVPGWYWVSYCAVCNPTEYAPPYAVQVVNYEGVLLVNLYSIGLDELVHGPVFDDAQWLGPFAAPAMPAIEDETQPGVDDVDI